MVLQDTFKTLMKALLQKANILLPTTEKAPPPSQDGPKMIHVYTEDCRQIVVYMRIYTIYIIYHIYAYIEQKIVGSGALAKV